MTLPASPTNAPSGGDETDAHIASLLGRYGGRKPDAPDWFRDALADEPTVGFMPHDGAELETLTWGNPAGARPPVVLVHGTGASGDWWRFIAPFIARDRLVVAFTFSGMGRSAWRPTYSFEGYADEVAAIAGHARAGSGRRPVVVGHSMGGMVSMLAATRPDMPFCGVLAIDSNMIGYRPPEDWLLLERAGREGGPPWPAYRVYPSLAEALARFRFLPPQTSGNDFVTDFIARANLKRVEGGWTWIADPKLRYLGQEPDFFARRLQSIGYPFAIARGGRSKLVSAGQISRILDVVPPGAVSFEIPDADHHVMVDQPLAVASALESFLSVWPDRLAGSSREKASTARE